MPVTGTPARPRLRAKESPAQSRPSTTAGRSAGKRVLVGGDRRVGDGRPGEPLLHACTTGLAEASAQVRVREQALERPAQGGNVARRDEDPRLAVDYEVEQAADRARDHGPSVCHRLGAGDAEALTVR